MLGSQPENYGSNALLSNWTLVCSITFCSGFECPGTEELQPWSALVEDPAIMSVPYFSTSDTSCLSTSLPWAELPVSAQCLRDPSIGRGVAPLPPGDSCYPEITTAGSAEVEWDCMELWGTGSWALNSVSIGAEELQPGSALVEEPSPLGGNETPAIMSVPYFATSDTNYLSTCTDLKVEHHWREPYGQLLQFCPVL